MKTTAPNQIPRLGSAMTEVSPNALTGGEGGGGGGAKGPPRLSRKLSVVARRAGRSSKALDETRLIHVNVLKSRSRVRSMSGQIKNTVFTVLTPESVRWAAKGSNVPKVLACSRKVLHGNEVSKTTSGHKRHLNKNHKHTVRHMCFLGHFAHRYLYSWSFDHITSFTLTWWSSGQGQIK